MKSITQSFSVFYLLVVFSYGCSSSKFSAESGAEASSTIEPSTEIIPTLSGRPYPSISNLNVSPIPTITPNSLGAGEPPCPDRKETVLILDLKSGWWNGDGGDFFNQILSGVSRKCVQSVTIEYHHITLQGDQGGVFPSGKVFNNLMIPFFSSTDILKGFEHQDWNNYSQVWVLSGSVGDPADLRSDSAPLLQMLEALKKSSSNVFLGSGNGNLTHANVFSNGLGLGTLFQTNLPEGPVIAAGGAFSISTHLKIRTSSKTHPLFQHIAGPLADGVSPFTAGSAGPYVKSDFLNVQSGVEVLADNADNHPVIGVLQKNGSRKIVLDAGIQRFYGIKAPNGGDNLKYLQNIILYLQKP